MNRLLKKSLSAVMSAVMVFTAFGFYFTSQTPKATAAQINAEETSANAYGLTEKIKDGAILHAWCWSFKTIKSNLEKIAEAGFTSVQTSPINKCVVGDNGGMDLMGNGKWYYHYQPVLYTIGNYQLGTLEEFEALCKEADNYGIKIIVDVVANHCSSDYNAIDSSIKNISGGAFHEPFSIGDWGNRYQGTQGQLLSLWDLNTQNTNVQQMILKYLKECVAAGADGFRYDAAKHIELPDDDESFASDFWPVILDNGSEFQYGEILQGSGCRIADYAELMSVTASSYGHVLRESLQGRRFSADKLKNYCGDGAPTEKLVTWVESHDNYTGDGSWSQINNTQIRQAWAVISARGDTTPLFFSRPDGSSTTSQWGKNKIGAIGDSNFCHPEVTAVNQFRNAMVGLPNKLSNPTDSNELLMIERGNAGAVIVNISSSDVKLNCSTDVADGTYEDAATGSIFTVSGGKLSGTVKAGAVAVIYNSTLTLSPSVSMSEDSCTFRNSITLTLECRNTTYSTYQIGNNPAVPYKSGDTITIGADMADNTSVEITLYGKNEEGEVSKTYTYTKISAPVFDGNTVVYFDNSEYNWSSVYVYAYHSDGAVKNAEWPGCEMTELGSGMYGYALDDSWDYSTAYVIFTNGSGEQYPNHNEPGYEISKGDKKIFNGSGLSDYTIEVPTQPQTTVPPVTVPTEPTAPTDPTQPKPTEPTDPTDPSQPKPTDPTAPTQPQTTPSVPVIVTEPSTQPSTPTLSLCGDVDLDNAVKINDTTMIQKHLASIIKLNTQQLANADTNADGSISIKDATLIQKYLANVVSQLPVK